MSQGKIKFEERQVYHIWTRANGSENLFREEVNYRYFLGRYAKYVPPVAETFAYCLMPNHLHLMVRVQSEDVILDYLRTKRQDPTLQEFGTLVGFSSCISQQFSNLFNGYTQAYNKKYHRIGSLFKPNFGRKIIDNPKYFARLVVYIHNNPVYHKFVKKPDDWIFSSYIAYLSNKSTKIEINEALHWFGGIEMFKDLHKDLEQEKLGVIFGR